MRITLSTSMLVRGSALFATAATLAATSACSDNQPTAPTAAPAVAAPNAAVRGLTTQQVTVRFKDINGNLIIAGWVPSQWLSLNARGDTTKEKIAYDNQFDVDGDFDPVLGVMRMEMPFAAKQRVCLYTFMDDYAYDILQPTPCNEASVKTYQVDLGTLTLRKKPRHTFFLKNTPGSMIVGATIHVTGPFGFDKTYTDGVGADLADGKILLKGENPGKYNWCEVTPPSGYKLTNPTCGIVNMFWEENTTQTLSHAR